MKKRVQINIKTRFTLLVIMEIIGVTILGECLVRIFHWFQIPDVIPEVVWVIFLGAVIGGAVYNFFSRRFFDPILKLSKAMKEVAEGNLNVSLEGNKELKEIQEIYTNFNIMTKELRATEILQTEFVSNVSHEFKTPISAIEGYAMLLQGEESLSEKDRNTYVEKILFNTKRLSKLVGNILFLSRIDNQTIQTKTSRFRLDEQIRQSIVLRESEWFQKEIELDVNLEEVEYEGAENLLFHVWDNLIGNAIKFSPHGGRISMDLTEEKEEVLFRISDQGAGITEAEKKHIFDKFYQGDSSHKQEGNGLGLALVKKILEVSSGKIEVENMAEGGCCFLVRLPNVS